jgi:predicted transcriptional regulator
MYLELKNKENKIRIKKEEQEKLEKAIIKYQESIKMGDSSFIEKTYSEVYKIYPAMNFAYIWFKKYYYLYDSKEDFDQDYLRIFCTSLVSWKPKGLRKKSLYNGSGQFKNYFWSSLQNNYINMVKAENSGKRNLSLKCPVCDEWCNSLSTHIIKKHDDLLWDVIKKNGFTFNGGNKCPFCKTYKIIKRYQNVVDEEVLISRLKKHILSMHSKFLFEEFKEQYPEYINLSSKPISVYVSNEQNDDGEVSIYDLIQQDSKIKDLYNSGLSGIQQTILNNVLNGNIKKVSISYDPKLYKCTLDDFQKELNNLKDKLFLCGIEK